MKGTNPIRSPEHGDGRELEVEEIFPTLQGEGPLSGTPAVFIRLGGCNLACGFCDTEFESFSPVATDTVIQEAKALSVSESRKRVRNLVVITGGEPFRQPIEYLCSELLNEGFQVQIETNGLLFRPIDERVLIICSPKNTGSGYQRLREDLLARTGAIKFIISDTYPGYDDIAEVGQSDYRIPVYLQPMDEDDLEKNHRNIARTITLCERHGLKLSLQLHKILGIP